MNTAKRIISLFFLTVFISCGGGTAGTGDLSPSLNRIAISGTVIDLSTGEPVVGASVTDERSGEEATTDSSGNFKVATVVGSQTTRLFIQGAEFDGSVTISDLPDAEANVTVEIELDTSNSSFTLASIEVQVLPSGIPIPATPLPARPTPIAPLPTPVPTAASLTLSGVITLGTRALSNAEIIVEDSRSSAVSNINGAFKIRLTPARQAITLRITVPNLIGTLRVRLSGLPVNQSSSVNVALSIKPKNPEQVGTASVNASDYEVVATIG